MTIAVLIRISEETSLQRFINDAVDASVEKLLSNSVQTVKEELQTPSITIVKTATGGAIMNGNSKKPVDQKCAKYEETGQSTKTFSKIDEFGTSHSFNRSPRLVRIERGGRKQSKIL